MPEIVDHWGAALLDAALAATALSGVVVLAMVQCRQPSRRRVWARAGLVSILFLLPLVAFNPLERIDLHRPLRSILWDDHDDRNTVARQPTQDLGGNPRRDNHHARRNPKSNRSRKGIEAQTSPSPAHRIVRVLVLIYLAGLGLGAGYLGLGIWGTWLLIRRSSGPSEGALGLYAGINSLSKMPRPRLRVSSRVGRPVLLGVARPAILIPPELDRPEAAERLAMSLMHELAHAQDCDPFFSLVANLAQAVWFFLPPVWWIRDQMRLDQEFLADQRAVESFGTSSQYASSLVGLAWSGLPERSFPHANRGGPADPTTGSSLTQRVLMLLRCPFAIERQAPLWWRFAAALSLGLATLGASSLTIRGLVEWSSSDRSSRAEVSRSFQLARLDVGPLRGNDPPFNLRFRLPDRFRLTLEIMAEPSDLPSIELLGHRLGSPLDGRMLAEPQPAWHRVQILRSGDSEEVEVDGNSVIDPANFAKLHAWLTIRPAPGRVIRIRNLELAW
ncbi:M56 family metallopeptidase [Tundrisphaera lichenicola]|uniref:M56 family metallopeptidase n=1 Tax=Tundrisphaera lichenicola TaxID=2029860 RepID=UPI003EB874EA